MCLKTLIGGVSLALCVAVAAPAAASTKSTIVSSSQMAKLENMSGDLGSLLNDARARSGASPVQRHSQLDKVAYRHATDMYRTGQMTHRGSDGSTIWKRVKRSGYCAKVVSENVAEGWPNDAAVFTGWMGSPAHRKNNLNKKMRHYGYARVGDFYVLVFGRPCR